MDKEEFDKRMLELDNDRTSGMRAIRKEYALAKNKVNIGDTVTDHQYTICVDKIWITVPCLGSFPECIYQGYRVKKSGERFKNEAYELVYQCNVVAHAPAQKQIEE